MSVKIVTDSVSDLPPDLVRDLGIAVVPLTLRFGDDSYRDGVDMSVDEFYQRLRASTVFPATSAPSPAAFAQAFDAATAGGGAALAITLSAKLSGTHSAALQGRSLAADAERVEVMDSGWAAIAEGFVVMAAARAARDGATIADAREAARAAGARIRLLAAFDTLEYLRRGGRVGAAASLLGSVLHVNPLIEVKDGEVQPAGRTRSRAKAIDELAAVAWDYARIDELAVSHAACAEDAEMLVERLSSFHPRECIMRTRMTPAIGCHTGPGLLVVTVLGDRK